MKPVKKLNATQTGLALASVVAKLATVPYREDRARFISYQTPDEEDFFDSLIKSVIAGSAPEMKEAFDGQAMIAKVHQMPAPAAAEADFITYADRLDKKLLRTANHLVEHAWRNFHQGKPDDFQSLLSGVAHLSPAAAQVMLTAIEKDIELHVKKLEKDAENAPEDRMDYDSGFCES